MVYEIEEQEDRIVFYTEGFKEPVAAFAFEDGEVGDAYQKAGYDTYDKTPFFFCAEGGYPYKCEKWIVPGTDYCKEHTK